MTSVPPELEGPTVNPDFDEAQTQTDRFEYGKGYDLSYFQDIREKYQGRRNVRRRKVPHQQGLVETTTTYPTRPALWLDFKKSKTTCSSRRTTIHNIQSKTAIENGMDHFTLSASQNVKEWSTDVSGYGNLAGEFMKTQECHDAVDAWTALVRKHQLKREKDSEWIAHHKEAEDQRKRKRVETIYGKTSGCLAATRTEAAASNANRQSNGGRIMSIGSTAQISTLELNCQEDGVEQIRNTQHSRGSMQLLRGAGQLTEADQPNQQPPLPATTSQINVDHFHQLSRSTADTQISTLELNCPEDGVVQISNTQHIRGSMQLLRGAGQLDEDNPPNQQPPLPATPSQINVDHFHQLSRATVDTQDSSFGLDCQVNGVVQVSNTQRSHSNMQLLSRGQLDEDYPPNQQPQLTANIFSSISCNTNRSTSVNAKPGRGRSTGSGTGSRRGNRGSQIRAVPVSGEGVTRNSYTTAYCYQSMYYALKPNSSPPEYYFISKGKLPSQYSITIELQKAPVLAKC